MEAKEVPVVARGRGPIETFLGKHLVAIKTDPVFLTYIRERPSLLLRGGGVGNPDPPPPAEGIRINYQVKIRTNPQITISAIHLWLERCAILYPWILCVQISSIKPALFSPLRFVYPRKHRTCVLSIFQCLHLRAPPPSRLKNRDGENHPRHQ